MNFLSVNLESLAFALIITGCVIGGALIASLIFLLIPKLKMKSMIIAMVIALSP